jgi:hypothetical protein
MVMSIALSVVTLTAVVLVGILVVRLTADVRALRHEMNHKTGPVITAMGLHHHRASMGKGYYALWRWDGKQWTQVLGVVPPGANAGLPPKEPGQFKGETKKVWVPVAKP